MPGSPKKKSRKEKQKQLMNTDEFWDGLFESIAGGMSVMEWCAVREIPYTTVQNRMKREPDLAAKLLHARESRAFLQAELIENLANKVESGAIDSQAARVAIDARKFLASKLDPHIYGDKIQADIKVQDVSAVYLDELKALMQQPKVINPEEE